MDQQNDLSGSSDLLPYTNARSRISTLQRLDRAFCSFFNGAGYPRFKSKDRFRTVEFPTYGDGCKIRGKKLYIQHVGELKVKWSRELPELPKLLRITRTVVGWFVVFICNLPEPELVKSHEPCIGIDLGLISFIACSDGELVSAPKLYRKSEQKLRRLSRTLSRKKLKSNRRAKAKRQLAKFHRHITNQRREWLHVLSKSLVGQYNLICVEDLNVSGMIQNRSLSKSISDASWSTFVNQLEYKAESAGKRIVKVDPKNTSQVCSQCSCLPSVKLDLSVRTYNCEHCGLILDRDVNAARNILRLGLSLQELTLLNAFPEKPRNRQIQGRRGLSPDYTEFKTRAWRVNLLTDRALA